MFHCRESSQTCQAAAEPFTVRICDDMTPGTRYCMHTQCRARAQRTEQGFPGAPRVKEPPATRETQV